MQREKRWRRHLAWHLVHHRRHHQGGSLGRRLLATYIVASLLSILLAAVFLETAFNWHRSLSLSHGLGQQVDWIESQGNYVALHVGAEQHLVRDTVSRFAARLDSRQFLRIHRSMIVAVDRVRAVEPLTNSDTLLHLARGGPLRASRSYAAAVKAVAAQLPSNQ